LGRPVFRQFGIGPFILGRNESGRGEEGKNAEFKGAHRRVFYE
jgi:hypothetical protein